MIKERRLISADVNLFLKAGVGIDFRSKPFFWM
jgi:hypothetical protein